MQQQQQHRHAKWLPSLAFISVAAAVLVITVSILFQDKDNTYFKIGPHDQLVVISVRIDTTNKYIYLVIITIVVTLARAIQSEIGSSVLRYLIYDYKVDEIQDVNRCSLMFYANIIYFFQGLRDVFLILASISQIDVSLVILGTYQIVCFFSMIYLTKDKKFTLVSNDSCYAGCLCGYDVKYKQFDNNNII
jgi:hypothetical protein